VGVTRLQDYGTTRPLISELTTDFTDGTDGSNRRKEMEERRGGTGEGLQDNGTTRPLISELTTDFTDGTDVEGRGKRGEGRWKSRSLVVP